MADVQKIIEVKLEASSAVNGIVNFNQQIKENNRLLQEMAENGQKGTKAYVMLEQQTKALTAEKRVLQREVQNEIKQEAELDGSLKQLRAELSNLTKEYDSLSRAERETGQRGKELKAQINQVTTEIKRAEEGTQRYYRNVGNYKNSILEAIGVNGNFGRSLLLMSENGAGFKGAMSAMGSSVKAFGASLMSLMSNPVFLALAGIAGAGMAFKWFYDYNVEIEKATRLTREFTGVTGDDLRRLRAEIQATASTYGKEYKDVLQGVDTLMSHFHLTSTEAMQTLNDGFAIGADINGNYLQLLKQYSPVFKDAGISAGQLVALIQQTRSGIFSEQGLEAIKQASARLREMSKGTRDSLQSIGINVDEMQQKLRRGQMDMFDAIQLVSNKLKELPDNAQEVGNVMADVFGRQGKFASQEMIESLGDIDTSLENLKEAAGEYGKALSDNQKATADLEEATAKMFGVGENGWETLKTRADTYWKQALTNAIKRTDNLLKRFADMGRRSVIFRKTAQVIVGVIGQMTAGIFNIFNGIGQGFKAIGKWIDAFVNTFKSAFGIIKDLGIGVGKILTGDVSEGVAVISRGLNSGVNNALKGINAALKATSDYVKGITTGYHAAYDAAEQFFDNYGLGGSDHEDGGGGSGGIDLSDNSNPDLTDNGGSGGGENGKTTPGKTTTPKTGKTDAEKEEEERQKRIKRLIEQGEALQKKALEEEAKVSEDAINRLADHQKAMLEQTFGDKSKYEGDALKAYEALLADINKKRDDAIKAFRDKQLKDLQENAKAQREDAKKLAEAIIAGEDDGSAKQLEWRKKLLELQLKEELNTLDNNERLKTQNLEKWEQMRSAIIAKYRKQQADEDKAYAERQKEIQEQVAQSKQAAASSLIDTAESLAGENKKALAVTKMLALGEIMISQAVAIANAVKAGSNAVNPWQMIAQIAASVAAVTTAMMSAFKALDEAKFATGGYIRGAGTGTSDSIPVRVSNGESVMNANTTAMFGSLLSSLNQLGGGVPIQVSQSAQSIRGEDMLARAVAKGVAMLPAPVVSVEDINRGQRQVEVMQERARL